MKNGNLPGCPGIPAGPMGPSITRHIINTHYKYTDVQTVQLVQVYVIYWTVNFLFSKKNMYSVILI